MTAPSSDLTRAERDDNRPAAPPSRDWLSRPLLRARSPKPAPEHPSLAPAETAPVTDEAEPAGPPLRPTLAEPAPPEEPALIQAPEPEPSVLTTPEPSPSIEPAGEPTVIGRYQSGASAYTMYSNGVIDVETEGGDVHRFGSMEELKAFIARQENALP